MQQSARGIGLSQGVPFANVLLGTEGQVKFLAAAFPQFVLVYLQKWPEELETNRARVEEAVREPVERQVSGVREKPVADQGLLRRVGGVEEPPEQIFPDHLRLDGQQGQRSTQTTG